MTFLTKFEFKYSRPFLSAAETDDVKCSLSWKLYATIWQETERTLSEAERVPDIFSAVFPCVAWTAETFMSVLTIKWISWKYMISVLLLPFGERRIICIRFADSFVRKNLNKWRAETLGYLSRTKDVIIRSIDRKSTSHPRRPWSQNRITSLWRWFADLLNQVSFYEKSMLLKSLPFSPDSIRYVS